MQVAIEARIDRLDTAAKRTLNAASVIGARLRRNYWPRWGSMR